MNIVDDLQIMSLKDESVMKLDLMSDVFLLTSYILDTEFLYVR